MGKNFGIFSYPGIEAYESFQWSDYGGIAPGVGILQCYPQYGLPDAEGDIKLQYDDEFFGMQTIIIKDCRIDAATFQQESNGKIVSVKFFDERWKWQFSEISGRYNIRLPNNWVDPYHEKTPRELATLCFEALGVTNFDVSALPNDSRPDVDWDHNNPAQELQRLCNDLGCRIVPKRSTGQWKIVVLGEGRDLPEKYPYQNAGDGIDPVEAPDYIKVVSAPIRYQMAFSLECVGRDTDHVWRRLTNLSYCPRRGEDFEAHVTACGFGIDPDTMSNIDPQRALQPDGTAISSRELAMSTVLRTFRLAPNWRVDPDGKAKIDMGSGRVFYIPARNEYATRRQIVVTPELVQAYTDELGRQHQRPAIMWGEFYNPIIEGTQNTKPGTRVDFQAATFQEEAEDRMNFGITIDPIDTDRTIISTSKPLMYFDAGNEHLGYEGDFGKPSTCVFLTCAIHLRDQYNWQLIRNEYEQKVGNGTDRTKTLIVTKDDIAPWYLSKYDKLGKLTATTSNEEEVKEQSRHYADAIAKKFQIVKTQTRVLIGLFPVDMDGAIQSVSYNISKGGYDTTVSKNTEHDYEVPSFDEREQRLGRKNTQGALEYFQKRQARLDRLRGTQNTL